MMKRQMTGSFKREGEKGFKVAVESGLISSVDGRMALDEIWLE